MAAFTRAEALSRVVKQELDRGTGKSIEEAEALFRTYRLCVVFGTAEARDVGHQIALLTVVALARRVFLGGVGVRGPLEVPLAVPLPLGPTLGDAVAALGGQAETMPASRGVLISIGGGAQPSGGEFHVGTVFAGWRGGVVPVGAERSPDDVGAMPLAPMLSAALAVNEAFLFIRGEAPAAGRRAVGLSLWRPDARCDWLAPSADEPRLRLLPSRLWLIGLGHLGQAYLWALGLLPFPDPREVSLVLQDVDMITPSTESTSILTDARMVGQKKTRAMAAWAEHRGFSTAIVERLFDRGCARQEGEPALALCGLDNALGRQALDQAGFDFVVEAGLGRGYRDFRSMRLHTLPGTRAASEIWRPVPKRDELLDRPAYNKLLTDGVLDQCGVTLLAGKAVGAPFVGAVAASLAVSEVLRLLHGGPLHQLIDLDLQSVEHRTTVQQRLDFSALNPGYTVVDRA